MSGTSFRKKIIKKNISNKKIKVLDIGCGPAEILNYIPKAIYHFNKSYLSKLPKFDFIILFGVLHHLSNKEIKNILNLCKKKMTKKSKLLTEDPILIKDQNLIANFLIKKDRGLNVRYKNDYKNLMKPHFKNINSKITHQFFIPYTWFSMICRK